jgi:hypothetical protein
MGKTVRLSALVENKESFESGGTQVIGVPPFWP